MEKSFSRKKHVVNVYITGFYEIFAVNFYSER